VPTLQQLHDNPLTVAEQHPITVRGLGAQVRAKADPGATLTFQQVYASRPVYAYVAPSEHGEMPVQATNQSGGNTRVYFLPWAHASIYRVRPNVSNTAGPADNLFFTPNLDGCVVVIDGSREAPTIYHCNASKVPFTGDEQLAMDAQPNDSQRELMETNLKVGKMLTDKARFAAILPKHAPPISAHPVPLQRVFDPHEYDPGSRHAIAGNEYGGIDIDQEVYNGTVFGVRKNGLWTFYKQSFLIRRKEHDEPAKEGVFSSFGFGKDVIARRKQITYTVAGALRMWP